MPFIRLTFALSWGVSAAYLMARTIWPSLPPFNAANPVFLTINCAPSLAAFLIVLREGGLAHARALAASTFSGFRFGAFIVACTFLPLLVCLFAGGTNTLGLRWPVTIQEAFVAMPTFLFTSPILFSNIAPIGEEYGWRGYALPILLQRHSLFGAAMRLGAIWVIWHIPAFLLGGIMAVSLASFFWWAAATVALTLCMTALYVRSGGNVLVAGLVPHAMINALGTLGLWLNRPAEVIALSACAAAAWLLTRHDQRKPPRYL